ncbi:MAG: PadR family transcriptional regulator [Candidatus Dormiibacterota bacterium]
MPSSLGYAILALVASKPQSGYDLARQMKQPLGEFWQAKHGQIYPELARLEKAGLVEFNELAQKSRPPRKVHAITPAGKAELVSWASKPPQERPRNDELVIKAHALRRISSIAAMGLLQTELEAHDHRLAALEQRRAALESRNLSGLGIDSPRFGDYAALRHAIGTEREYVAWCRWLLAEVSPKTKARPAHRPSRSKRQVASHK